MKGKTIIGTIAGFIFGIVVSFGVYYLTAADVAWEEFLNNTLIPTAFIVLTSIGTISVAATPIINRVIKTLEKFNQATKDVNETAENGSLANKDIKAYGDQLEKFTYEISDIVKPLADDVANIKTMCKIGFCNSDELVEKGYAVDIAKLAKEGSENEERREELES